MDSRADVLMIGFGPVGILKSYILEKGGKARVTALARSNAVACAKGVRIESADPQIRTVEAYRPFRVVDYPAQANDRTYKAIFVSTKCLPEIKTNSQLLATFLSGNRHELPIIVLLQNGMGIEADVHAAYPKSTLISSAVYMSANVKAEEPYTISSGPLGRTIFGLYKGEPDRQLALTSEERQHGGRALAAIAHAFHSGGWQAETAENIYAARFVKNLFNCSLSGICAICRTPGAGAFGTEENKALLLAIGTPLVDELLELARAMGMGEDVVTPETKDQILEFLGKFQPSFKPSMQVDLEAGRMMEIEPIVGYLVRKGAALKLSMPNLSFMYAVLKVQQNVTIAKMQTEGRL